MKFPLAALVLAASFAASSYAQTLARPGWAGSGMNVQPWWKHAVIYEIDVRGFQDSNGDGAGDLKGIVEHLDYLKSLGVDAILLDSLAEPAPSTVTANTSVPIDPALGTVDDFDALSREASRHDIRILLSLKSKTNADAGLLPIARFWLTRGVAGFRLDAVSADVALSLRRLVSTYAGQRVLITNADVANATQRSPDGLVLDSTLLSIKTSTTLPGQNAAASIRQAMEHSQIFARGDTPLFATDGAGVIQSVERLSIGTNGASDIAHNEAVAKIIGTVLLLNRSASLVYFGQELGLHSAPGESVAIPWGLAPHDAKPEVQIAPPPAEPPIPARDTSSEKYVPYVAPSLAARVATPSACGRCKTGPESDSVTVSGQDSDPNSALNFYRQLSRLHHGNTALRDGEEIMLNHDDANALVWIRKMPSVTPLAPAVVIVCNLSDRPLVLPLKAEMARMHLRGSFLRTIMRSDDAMGSMHLDPITVPPFGVYIGELRY